jgi:nitrogen regulatory protein PII
MSETGFKRIEIVTEALRAKQVTDILDKAGATGWTMLPVLSGKGHHGVRHGGDPSGISDNVMIVVIASAEHAQSILAKSDAILAGRTAILAASDVTVIRKDRF